MSSTLNGSSEIQCFDHSNVIKVRDEINTVGALTMCRPKNKYFFNAYKFGGHNGMTHN